MDRKKMKLARIARYSVRNSTFKKRKESLMKKARELATLCNIKVCVVIFGEGQEDADVWPPSLPVATEILTSLKSMTVEDKSKKMIDRESFMRERVDKAVEQLRRVERENAELESMILMHQCVAGRSLEDVSAADLGRLMQVLNLKLKIVTDRLERVRFAQGWRAMALEDAATPAAPGHGLALTTATLAAAPAPAGEKTQGGGNWSMDAALAEFQMQRLLTGEIVQAGDRTLMEEPRTQNMQLEKAPAQDPAVEHSLNMQNNWWVQPLDCAPTESQCDNFSMVAQGKAPMEEKEEPQNWIRIRESPANMAPIDVATEAGLWSNYWWTSGGKASQYPTAAVDLQCLQMPQGPTEALQRYNRSIFEKGEGSSSGGGHD